MYIPEFVCGILATLAAEVVVIIGAAIYITVKGAKGKGDDKSP